MPAREARSTRERVAPYRRAIFSRLALVAGVLAVLPAAGLPVGATAAPLRPGALVDAPDLAGAADDTPGFAGAADDAPDLAGAAEDTPDFGGAADDGRGFSAAVDLAVARPFAGAFAAAGAFPALPWLAGPFCDVAAERPAVRLLVLVSRAVLDVGRTADAGTTTNSLSLRLPRAGTSSVCPEASLAFTGSPFSAASRSAERPYAAATRGNRSPARAV